MERILKEEICREGYACAIPAYIYKWYSQNPTNPPLPYVINYDSPEVVLDGILEAQLKVNGILRDHFLRVFDRHFSYYSKDYGDFRSFVYGIQRHVDDRSQYSREQKLLSTFALATEFVLYGFGSKCFKFSFSVQALLLELLRKDFPEFFPTIYSSRILSSKWASSRDSNLESAAMQQAVRNLPSREYLDLQSYCNHLLISDPSIADFKEIGRRFEKEPIPPPERLSDGPSGQAGSTDKMPLEMPSEIQPWAVEFKNVTPLDKPLENQVCSNCSLKCHLDLHDFIAKARHMFHEQTSGCLPKIAIC